MPSRSAASDQSSHHLFCVLYLEMASTIPISNICMARNVPPELKKGSETPVFGIELVTTATFKIACKASFKEIPYTASEQNRSGA